MKKTEPKTKNKFDSLTDEGKIEMLSKYVNKYKAGSAEALTDLALKHNIAGKLVSDSNFQF